MERGALEGGFWKIGHKPLMIISKFQFKTGVQNQKDQRCGFSERSWRIPFLLIYGINDKPKQQV
ncbi:hypothetical protein EFB08_20700 [Rufibacter latericius]|uniref:Uncharacterized protein n=1 Tax=Rufibacter latericius TaxID=2487040 RepID=A0A3M9MAE9_9BACT|nr:hypothetical protein EFB08_20700 [Rufibacter latericius]